MDKRKVRGLELGRVFYGSMVRPVLDRRFPGLPHTACLIGGGSEILGFDDGMSRDHHWGPRVMIFLRPADMKKKDGIGRALSRELPRGCLGFPVNFTDPDPADKGVRLMKHLEEGPVNHRVEFFTVKGFFADYLGFDVRKKPAPSDWLSFPQQKLASLTAGEVYHDDLGLEKVREEWRYFPPGIRLCLLAACWRRIGQEEHLMGRAGMCGDELGSSLIASRIARDIMRICFLMERKYIPYPKWLGTAFARLSCGPGLGPVLTKAVMGRTWKERERHLMSALAMVSGIHNRLGITDRIPEKAKPFWDRPFLVFGGEGIAATIAAAIRDQRIARMSVVGSVDTASDNTDLLCAPSFRKRLRRLFDD
jgi:hypothetical protein